MQDSKDRLRVDFPVPGAPVNSITFRIRAIIADGEITLVGLRRFSLPDPRLTRAPIHNLSDRISEEVFRKGHPNYVISRGLPSQPCRELGLIPILGPATRHVHSAQANRFLPQRLPNRYALENERESCVRAIL